jgi:thymidine phosphorylase
VDVAAGNGLPVRALLTDMDRVLGRTAGNALEVREAIDHLTGAAGDPRLLEITLELSRELLALGGLQDRDPAEALRKGAAAERFAAMVVELGGPADLLEAPDRHLPVAEHVVAVVPERSGVVSAVDVRAVGLAVVALGGGRTHEAQDVDHAVGLSEVAAVGEYVGVAERPLALVHARSEDDAAAAAAALRAAFTVADEATSDARPAILERLGAA